jgi:alkylation response protein AidB-like acyl-CoA dehydrogenase
MYRLNDDQQRIVADAATAADNVLAKQAAQVDRDATFPEQSLAALGERGLLGLTIAQEFGGLGQGLRTMAAVLDTVAQRCPSTAMVYLMHLCGTACYATAPQVTANFLRDAAAGRHLSTLAFSETGSRSHFWAPVSRATDDGDGNVRLNASKSFVTSAGHADGYVISTLAANATNGLESTLYLVLKGDGGVAVTGAWKGLGMRGNASAPMVLDNVIVNGQRTLTTPGKGLDTMLGVVLPAFQVGSAAVAVGIAEAAVQATIAHVTQARMEHMNSTVAAAFPTVRAQVARMRIETDRARAHLGAVLDSIESPGPATQLMVLEAKTAATEAAVTVTDMAMRACGGAAFGGAHGIERLFRDARAPIVMAPTSDQANEFIGRALCGMEVF